MGGGKVQHVVSGGIPQVETARHDEELPEGNDNGLRYRGRGERG